MPGYKMLSLHWNGKKRTFLHVFNTHTLSTRARCWIFLRKTYKLRFFIVSFFRSTHSSMFATAHFSIYFICFCYSLQQKSKGENEKKTVDNSSNNNNNMCKMLFTVFTPSSAKKLLGKIERTVMMPFCCVCSIHEAWLRLCLLASRLVLWALFWKFVVFSCFGNFHSSHNEPLTMNCPAIKLV